MNKWQKHLWVLLLILALCLVPVVSAANGGEEPVTELQSRYRTNDALNGLRNNLGLKTLSIVSELRQAAQNHSYYMYSAKKAAGLEVQYAEGFTGVSAMDRVLYAGYDGQTVLEINANRTTDYTQMLKYALHDPAKRYALLHPGYDGVGYGITEDYGCVLLGSSKGAVWSDIMVMYPYAGQQEVGNCSLARLGDEVPSAVAQSTSRYLIGEPITITYYTPGGEPLEFRHVKFTLTDTKRGQEVGTSIVLPQEQFQLVQTMSVYPLEMYNTDTRYEVSFACEIWCNDELLTTVEQVWSYTSSGPDSIGEISRLDGLVRLAQIFGISQEAYEKSPENQFRDYAYNAQSPESILVYHLAQGAIVDAGNTLLPNEGVAREQMAVWMMRLLRQNHRELYDSIALTYDDTFEDINECSTDEVKAAVQRAYMLGLVKDQGGGKFSPTVYITRTEFESWMTALEDLLPAEPEATE